MATKTQPLRARTAGVAGLVSAIVLLTGCSGVNGGNDDALKIGYAGFDVDTAFLSTLSSNVESAGTEAGADITVSSAGSDATKQANDFNTLLSSGVQGILVDPVNADAIVPAINKASQAGTKVVVIDGAASPSDGIAIQVATDNYGAGVDGCEVIGKRLEDKGESTVLNLQGGLDNQAAQGRTEGFEKCMADSYPDIKVVSKSYEWDADKCSKIVQTQFSSQQIDGVFSASAQCLGPVQSVLENQGRLAPSDEEDHVPFAIVDGTPEELDAVRDGTLTASIAQPLDSMASAGVYWLQRAIKDEPIEAGPTDHGSEVVDRDGSLRDLLQPIVVTSENVDDSALWGNQ